MALITREQFEQRQKEIAERQSLAAGPRVGFFSLKNDGDEAIVRFCHTDPEDAERIMAHGTRIGDGKFKTISCLREGYRDSYDKCPLCKAGEKASTQLYIRLIQYERAEDGTITATPKVWARSNSFVQQSLVPKYEEYGDLKDIVCKIKRHGAPNQTSVQYIITKLNSTIYSDDQYPKMEDAFEGYSALGTAVRVMDYTQIADLVGEGTVAETVKPAVSTPVVETPVATAPRKVATIESDDLPF